jgi:hypothetical protein
MVFHFVQVKRRLVAVAVVARGDVFFNFASFQEVLLKVQLPIHLLYHSFPLTHCSVEESSNSSLKMLLAALVQICLCTLLVM